jgi:hypothetical protein
MPLSADIYSDDTGKKWSAVIRRHHPDVTRPSLVWERHGMASQWHAESAMDAAWNRIQAADAAIRT